MRIFSFHLLATPPIVTLSALIRPPSAAHVSGLRHTECFSAMTLGSPILSRERFQTQHLAVFADWENESSLERFLKESKLGNQLATGWHVRLRFLRRWGHLREIADLPPNKEDSDPQQPVIAVTVARLRLSQLPRFIHWGRPVEKMVKDHPSTAFSMAAFRPPATFCTFSVWQSQSAMTDMVFGKGTSEEAKLHRKAMEERNRKDFHYEFATYRFHMISESGTWAGRSRIVPPSG